REFFLILTGLHANYEGHALNAKSPLLIDEEENLRPWFSREDIQRVMAIISCTPDDLALKLLSEPRQNWAMDVTPLRSTPIIQLFPGKYSCPDSRLLYRCLIDRIYFLLQDAYPEGQFSQLFGYLFEDYIHCLIREFAYEGTDLVRTFYASPFFEGTTDEA